MKTPLLLWVSGEAVRVRLMRRRAAVWAAEYQYENDGDLRDAITRLPAERKLEGSERRLRVELDRSAIQVRTLTGLPPVHRGALRSMIGHRSTAIFRRRGGPLVVDAAWMDKERKTARAVAANQSLVDAIVDGASAAALTVVSIDVPDPDVSRAFSLLPPRARRAARRAAMKSVALMGAVALATWTLAGAVYTLDLVHDHREISAQLDSLQAPLEDLTIARRQLADVATAVRALQEVQRSRGWATGVLASITAALPDSAFLYSITLEHDRGGMMVGAGVPGEDAVRSLESVTRLEAPRLMDRLTGEDGAGGGGHEIPEGAWVIAFDLQTADGSVSATTSGSGNSPP